MLQYNEPHKHRRHGIAVVWASAGTTLMLLIGAVVLGVSARSAGAYADDPPAHPPFTNVRDLYAYEQTRVRLESIPPIMLPPTAPPTPAEVAHIKDLIQQLAQIDHPDYGLSPTVSGTAFSPIAGSESANGMLLTNPGLQPSRAFTELVRLGPRAMPFLLDALDDKTPTRLRVWLQTLISWMKFQNDIPANPANLREVGIVAALPEEAKKADGTPLTGGTGHIVTVGDVCFVAIGQITGRDYEAIRYRWTAGIEVVSPTSDPDIARAVRAIWSSDNPTQHLLDSLLQDYSTRGVADTDSNAFLMNVSLGSAPQVTAAMRLLFYFPHETRKLVVDRLNRFQIRSEKDPDKRDLANGVLTADFLKAVAWCQYPAVRTVLQSIFRRTDGFDLQLISLRALDASKDWEIVQDRFKPLPEHSLAEDYGWYGDDYETLVAVREFGGNRARPLYRQYLKGASAKRCLSVCEALKRTKGDWDREFLWPLLSDHRPGKGYSHPVVDGDTHRDETIRVCDEAAEIISQHRPELKFEMYHTIKQLDEQIAVMQKQLLVMPR